MSDFPPPPQSTPPDWTFYEKQNNNEFPEKREPPDSVDIEQRQQSETPGQKNTFSLLPNVDKLSYSPPHFNWRDALVLPLSVVLFDLSLYAGGGFSGFALIFLFFPLLILFGRPQSKFHVRQLLVYCLLVMLGLSMIWSGEIVGVLTGFLLIGAFSMSLFNLKPFVFETLSFLARCVPGGIFNFIHLMKNSNLAKMKITINALAVFVPLLVAIIFGFIFIMANPSLQDMVNSFLDWIDRLFSESPITVGRIVFWGFACWLAFGLIRPWIHRKYERYIMHSTELCDPTELKAAKPHIYLIARNTLIMTTCLFAAYLCFEIFTQATIELPNGGYARYSHNGAAWLTLALFVSTATLGFIFRGNLLNHASVGILKRFTWCWSLENFVLALCVINRLMMYIHYNGMSRMRMVAIYGIVAVLFGFMLTSWKVVSGRTLLWLIRRDLWALSLMIYLYIVTPVDWIVTRYNVSQILSGNPSPSVQLVAHPISAEGVPSLIPLLNVENKNIREGAAALLCQRQLEILNRIRTRENWSDYQYAENRSRKILAKHEQKWESYLDDELRNAVLESFNRFGRQWY